MVNQSSSLLPARRICCSEGVRTDVPGVSKDGCAAVQPGVPMDARATTGEVCPCRAYPKPFFQSIQDQGCSFPSESGLVDFAIGKQINSGGGQEWGEMKGKCLAHLAKQPYWSCSVLPKE